MKNKCTLCCVIKKLWDDLISASLMILSIISVVGATVGITIIALYAIGLIGNYFYPISPMVHYYDFMNIFTYGLIISLIISIFVLAIVTIIVTSVFIIYKAFGYLKDLYYDCK